MGSVPKYEELNNAFLWLMMEKFQEFVDKEQQNFPVQPLAERPKYRINKANKPEIPENHLFRFKKIQIPRYAVSGEICKKVERKSLIELYTCDINDIVIENNIWRFDTAEICNKCRTHINNCIDCDVDDNTLDTVNIVIDCKNADIIESPFTIQLKTNQFETLKGMCPKFRRLWGRKRLGCN